MALTAGLLGAQHEGVKAVQGIALVCIWLLGLPLVISIAVSAAWNDTGGIDSGDAPSTAASLGAWLLGLGGVGVLIALSVVVSRLGDDDHPDDGSERRPPERDPWDRWKT